MELQQLRYVIAVAKTGNFSRAAELCHVSQPSLSQQIQKLEAELEIRLFDRMKKRSVLTPQGEAFLPRALKILDEVAAATLEAQETTELTRGTVRFGVLPTIAPYLLPKMVAAFGEKYPALDLIMQEDTTEQLQQLLLDCEIDFALASLPLDENAFEICRLFNEELLLALPQNHHLARKKTLSISDLSQEKLIVMKDGHCLGDQVLGFCEQRQVKTHITFRSAQLETIQALIDVEVGLSLIPAMAAEKKHYPHLIYRSFKDPQPTRSIVAFWPKHRPPDRAASVFLQTMAENLAENR